MRGESYELWAHVSKFHRRKDASSVKAYDLVSMEATQSRLDDADAHSLVFAVGLSEVKGLHSRLLTSEMGTVDVWKRSLGKLA